MSYKYTTVSGCCASTCSGIFTDGDVVVSSELATCIATNNNAFSDRSAENITGSLTNKYVITTGC